jgi:hypothetical protein
MVMSSFLGKWWQIISKSLSIRFLLGIYSAARWRRCLYQAEFMQGEAFPDGFGEAELQHGKSAFWMHPNDSSGDGLDGFHRYAGFRAHKFGDDIENFS